MLTGFRGWALGISAGFLMLATLVSASLARAAGPEDELPDGEGKKILRNFLELSA